MIKATVTIGPDEAVIELIPETTTDRDSLSLAINTNLKCTVKKNGTFRFIMPVEKLLIGKASGLGENVE